MNEKPQLTENEILERAAETMLDEPIVIEISVEPRNWLEKMLMRFKIKPRVLTYIVDGIKLGTLIRLSRYLLQMNYNDRPADGDGVLPWAYKGIIDNTELAVKVIALAIHNKPTAVPDGLERLIIDNFTAKDLKKTAFNIITKMDVFVFMNTITSIRQIQILKGEVSPQPAEIIAPEQTPLKNTAPTITDGEQSAILSSIFDGLKIT